MEIWQDIPSYGGVYQVSGLGNVRRANGRLLRPRLDADGYPKITLGKKGSRRSYRVHTLVLNAFVGPRPDGMECRHLNGDRTDARLENLCWGTSVENKADMARHGTVLRGQSHPMARLTKDQVDLLRKTKAVRKACRELGISEGHAYRIRAGGNWRVSA